MPVITEVRRLSLEDHYRFKASLDAWVPGQLGLQNENLSHKNKNKQGNKKLLRKQNKTKEYHQPSNNPLASACEMTAISHLASQLPQTSWVAQDPQKEDQEVYLTPLRPILRLSTGGTQRYWPQDVEKIQDPEWEQQEITAHADQWSLEVPRWQGRGAGRQVNQSLQTHFICAEIKTQNC